MYFIAQKHDQAQYHITTLGLYLRPNLKKQNSDISSSVEDKDDLRVLGLVLKQKDFTSVPFTLFKPGVTGQSSYPPQWQAWIKVPEIKMLLVTFVI